MALNCLGAVLLGYILGSIPFGYLVVRWRLGRDIREMGSGNIGATNVSRILGKVWGRTVLVLDILKGLFSVIGAEIIWGNIPMSLALAGLGAILGHIFPLYIGFKGGKGVATGIGVILGLGLFYPTIILILGTGLLGWFFLYRFTGYVSIGSIVFALIVLIGAWVVRIDIVFRIFLSCLAVLVIYRHRENIARLIKGRERRTEL